MEAVFRGGPSGGQTREIDDAVPSTIGDPSEGGVYERTGEREDGRPVYRWRNLSGGQATDQPESSTLDDKVSMVDDRV